MGRKEIIRPRESPVVVCVSECFVSYEMMWLRVALMLFLLYFATLFNGASLKDRKSKKDFLLLTVASNETEGYQRFIRSAKVYNVPVKVLGMGQKWLGGDMKSAGGGYKINLLLKELNKYKDQKDKIIVFTDSYDVILTSGPDKIIEQFENFGARLLFSAERSCWPDESLADQYPTISRGKRFLCSGGFIGYADDLYAIVSSSPIKDSEDDQLFYTKIFLDTKLREKHKIQFKGKEAYLQNTAYGTVPLVIHGNGPSKPVFNTLGNYLANAWNPQDGCVACWEDVLSPLSEMKEEYHAKDVKHFIEELGEKYLSVKEIKPEDKVKEWHARNLAINHCLTTKCDYFFNVDAVAHLDNPSTLPLLIEQNRTIVGPMLTRPQKAWSNFWGALTAEGFYARSMDYMEIVRNERNGKNTK
ncbi:hypothetical protein J437_LFUL011771 [Ladona fulva]|uniref:PLOD1-3-like GT domain-containing protein n=1 Tax=Ladona fulva TaxID=123851 RepID=A0A8K0KD25_LADFU|nr:hypothetical protein J437_LFUL011771 [Ladona fulva]